MNRTLAIIMAVAMLGMTAILAGSIPGTFPVTTTPPPTPTPPRPAELAFGSATNTEAATVAADNAVLFSGAGTLRHVSYTPPDTLTIEQTWDGTYEVAYEVNLTNTTGSDVTDTFAVEVGGERMGDTRASILVPAGGTVTLRMRAQIPIPAGKAVRLVNVGTDPAEPSNIRGGVPVPSATLNLQRTGDLPQTTTPPLATAEPSPAAEPTPVT